MEGWAWERDAFDVVAAIFIQFAEPPLRKLIFEACSGRSNRAVSSYFKATRPRQIEYGTG
ncbi:hypothetical protein [Mesorhizobium sp. 10J20-29]